MLEEMASVFFDEANELLDNLEEQLLTLEKNPTDTETIGAVFRAMHTIKGSAAMFRTPTASLWRSSEMTC